MKIPTVTHRLHCRFLSAPLEVHLGPSCCVNEVVVHELLHILGAFHEQNRPDRDQHVTVNWGGILPAFRRQFYKNSGPGEM